MTGSWQQVLGRASKVSPRCKQLGPAVAALLDEGLRGAPSQDALQRAYGVAALASATRNPFADSLSEAAYREAGQWRPQTLAAVRGCLRLVPQLMLDLYAVFRGDKVFPTQGDESFPARLAELGASGKLRWLEPRTSPTGYLCARCGFLGVQVQRERAAESSLFEGRCPACAEHHSWRGPDDAWPHVDDDEPYEERLEDRHAVQDYFARRGDDPFKTPRGFTIARNSSEGLPLAVEVAYQGEHRIYHVIAGLPLPAVPGDRRAEIALGLAEINREIEAQGFLLGDRIAYRTHAYTNTDGSISARVIADTVNIAVAAADRYLARLRELLDGQPP